MAETLLNPTGKPQDTKWTVWARMLCKYQSEAGANPDLNLKLTDTKWKIKYKLLRAILNA